MASYNCNDCGKVSIGNNKIDTCPKCGSKNGRYISNKALKDYVDTGIFSNADSKITRIKKKDQ